MKKKLLVLGVSGLTGYKIAKQANSKFDVYGTYNTRSPNLENSSSFKVDIRNTEEIQKLFSNTKPDFVINTTALHNVDYCEENSKEAFLVNSKAVKEIRKNCNKLGSKFVHISTDYVFDGAKNSPYTENENPKPVSVYGESKLAGEEILTYSVHSVLRPSVVYGWTPLELAGTTSSSGKPMNFAMWLLTKLQKNEPLKIVTDQFASATLADSLAESALQIAQSEKSGLFHVSGLSCESRYEFSIKLAKEFGYSTDCISPVTSSEFKQKAKRPAYSCLNCQKAIKTFGLNLLTTENALKIMREQVEIEAPAFLRDSKR